MSRRKYSEEEKLKAIAMLSQNRPAREVAEALDISIATIMKYKDSFDAGKVTDVVDLDTILVERVAKEMIEDVGGIEGEVMDIVEGVDRSKILSNTLHDSATNIAKQIDLMVATGVAGPSELAILVDSLATLQSSFFNKNVTNVQVLNAPGAAGGVFNGFKSTD